MCIYFLCNCVEVQCNEHAVATHECTSNISNMNHAKDVDVNRPQFGSKIEMGANNDTAEERLGYGIILQQIQ